MGLLEIKPGHRVDVLDKDELREVLDEYERLFRQEARDRVAAEADGLTDGTGAVTIVAYQVPLGMEFRLTRLVVQADGSSFAVPYTNAAGSVEVHRDGQLVDGFNLASGLPNVGTDGGTSAAFFRNGAKLEIVVVGGPANTNIRVLAEGDLFPRRSPA